VSWRTAFVAHAACGRHDTGWGHPEHQGRLPAIVRALERDTPALQEHVLQQEAVPAAPDTLRLVHSAAHIETVREAVARARETGEIVRLDPDTAVSGASWEAALASAGAALGAVDLVLNSEADTAFAAARPPGHHATPDRAMGFCLFNNVAIAARHAQTRGMERVLIVDWDVHHGNGTQDAFYEDPTVYYFSSHLAAPHYPGTGAAGERGAGPGRGTTRNLPLPPGTDGAAFREAVTGALDATLAEFRPDMVLVSAGFDCLDGDPLGGMRLEPRDLHWLTRWLLDATRDSAHGRMALVLEGGYAPDRLGAGVVDVMRALAGLPPKD